MVESIVKVLDGKAMGVNKAAETVRNAGSKTNPENFRTMVNIALITSGKFKRVDLDNNRSLALASVDR